MRDRMVPTILLSRLRSRDVLHILRIDSDPQDDVKVVPVSLRQIGLAEEIATLYTQHIQPIEQTKCHACTNDIGGALAYANRIAKKLQANGSASQVIVMAFSDGKLEGPQTKLRSEWPEGVQVWFWGIEHEHEAALKKWCTQQMQLSDDQLNVVLFSDWETDAPLFGQKIGRRFPDEQLMQRLQTAG